MKKMFSVVLAGGLGVALSVASPVPTVTAQSGIDGENVVAFLNSVIANGNEMLSKARASSDVALMDCINNQLINAKGFLNVAQTSSNSLKDAKGHGDSQAVSHNEKLLELASTKGREIDTSIKQCASGVVKFTGDTTLKVHRDCQYPPCQQDAAKDPSTNEGQSIEEQAAVNDLIPNNSSPYL